MVLPYMLKPIVHQSHCCTDYKCVGVTIQLIQILLRIGPTVHLRTRLDTNNGIILRAMGSEFHCLIILLQELWNRKSVHVLFRWLKAINARFENVKLHASKRGNPHKNAVKPAWSYKDSPNLPGYLVQNSEAPSLHFTKSLNCTRHISSVFKFLLFLVHYTFRILGYWIFSDFYISRDAFQWL